MVDDQLVMDEVFHALASRARRDMLGRLAVGPLTVGQLAAPLAMSLAALDTGSARTAAGGALFLVSDSMLALEKFGGVRLPAHEGLVMATYASAQALLACPVVRRE